MGHHKAGHHKAPHEEEFRVGKQNETEQSKKSEMHGSSRRNRNLQSTLRELRSASDGALSDLRKGLGSAVSQLRQSMGHAAGRFNQVLRPVMKEERESREQAAPTEESGQAEESQRQSA